eukprot:gene12203-8398_t
MMGGRASYTNDCSIPQQILLLLRDDRAISAEDTFAFDFFLQVHSMKEKYSTLYFCWTITKDVSNYHQRNA